jgi:hypothetical protein
MGVEVWKIEQNCQNLYLPGWALVLVDIGVLIVITIIVRSEVVGFLLPAYMRQDRAYLALTQSKRGKRRTKKRAKEPIRRR